MVDVLFSFLCVLISIRCLGCSFKEIFRTLKDFLLLLLNKPVSKPLWVAHVVFQTKHYKKISLSS